MFSASGRGLHVYSSEFANSRVTKLKLRMNIMVLYSKHDREGWMKRSFLQTFWLHSNGSGLTLKRAPHVHISRIALAQIVTILKLVKTRRIAHGAAICRSAQKQTWSKRFFLLTENYATNPDVPLCAIDDKIEGSTASSRLRLVASSFQAF